MNIHVHSLDAFEDHDFLTQGRKDPVTGEPLVAGCEIVICSHCKSAFLLDSWAYMGNKHCGRSDTLSYLPKSKKVLLANTPSMDLLFEYKSSIQLKRFGTYGAIGAGFLLSKVLGFSLLFGSMLPLAGIAAVLGAAYFLKKTSIGKLQVYPLHIHLEYFSSVMKYEKKDLMMDEIVQMNIEEEMGNYFLKITAKNTDLISIPLKKVLENPSQRSSLFRMLSKMSDQFSVKVDSRLPVVDELIPLMEQGNPNNFLLR